MLNINDKELEIQIDKLYGVLGSLRLSNGFYKAANSGQYNYTWLRDNFYCALSELYKKPTYYQQTLQTWLDYYKDAESKYGKFSSLINKGKIDYDWEFPNPRIDLNLNEIHNQSWGHVQFDTIGYFFRGIYLGERNGLKIIRNKEDREIINKAIKMMENIEYWKLPDSGIWEEAKENRTSSCGAVVSGLVYMKNMGFKVDIPKLVDGMNHYLYKLLPQETKTRETDLSLLTLIFPFYVLPKRMALPIIEKIENELVRENGTIRYHGDQYYNKGSEAQWTLGNLFLGIIYADYNEYDKARYYYDSVMKLCPDGVIPELYHSDGSKGNNKPLGWSVSLAIILAEKLKSIQNNNINIGA